MQIPRRWFGVALALLVGLLDGAAWAHSDPVACSGAGLTLSVAAVRSDGVTPIGGGVSIE